MNDDEARWRRCLTEIHEAAHAVVAWAQGRRLRVIVVRPRAEGLGGFVQHEPRADLSPLEAAIIDLTTIEAGRLAEDMVFPDAEPDRPTEADYGALTERWIQVLSDAPLRSHVQVALSGDGSADPSDEDLIASVAGQFAPDEAIWVMALCRARATRLIAEHRGAILALAAELSRRPILDGRTAEAVIESSKGA